MAKYSFLRKYYPFIVLVVGICLVCCVVNVKEAFANPVLQQLIDTKTVPNSEVISIYLLNKNANDIKTVALAKPNSKIAKTELNKNMLKITLDKAYSVHDFVAYGFGSNKQWNIGTVDSGDSSLSLLDGTKTIRRQNVDKKKILNGNQLPKSYTTLTIGPIVNAGFPTLDLTGDPAKDGGKVSGLSNVRIDILISK